MSEPHVYFVGAGLGTADLLTVRASHLLARADVVLHDALVDQAVLALASQARRYCVRSGARNHGGQRRCGRLAGLLTLRGVARAVTFLTPCVCDVHDDATWEPAIDSLRAGGSLGVYMAGRHIAATAERLIASGALAATPIAVLESVSLADSRHWLGTLATASVSPPDVGSGPVVLLIGEALRSALERASEHDAEIARAA